MRFRSSILPPWARKSPKVAEVLPLMYLHGMSSGDFVPALEEFFGSAAGLSASVITRLTTDWQRERDQFAHRSLKDVDYVYLFADGIHFNVRLEEARLCALVIVGVRADGTKELVSITDGHRESAARASAGTTRSPSRSLRPSSANSSRPEHGRREPDYDAPSSSTSKVGTTRAGCTPRSAISAPRNTRLSTSTPTVRRHNQHKQPVRRTGSSPRVRSL